MSILLSSHQIKSLINQSKVLIIGKNSFNHMKVSK